MIFRLMPYHLFPTNYFVNSLAKYIPNTVKKMKTLISTLLVLVSFLAFGQSPYQISDSTKRWNTIQVGFFAWNIAGCAGTKTTKFQEEVMINNEPFFKVFEAPDSLQQNWSHIGYLREDTVSKKVYYTNLNAEEIGLIYDFSLSVGDSVIVENYYAGYEENVLMVCDSIDFIEINGRTRKRFFLQTPGYWYYDIWIEGVGSTSGLFYSGFVFAGFGGGGPHLLCCSHNDTLIYMNPRFNACYYRDFYPKIVSESFDTAYLNTSYEFQIQLSHTINIDSFALIGEVIPEGFELDETTGLLTGMPLELGSFTCVIRLRNYNIGYFTDIIYAEIPVVLPTGILDEPKESLLKIHPNPFSTSFLVSFEKAPKDVYYLEIFNHEGKMIDKRTLTENQSEIDCSAFKDGIYLLKITDSNQQIIGIEKVMKN